MTPTADQTSPTRRRVRRVGRVIRSVDAWTVFRVAAVFHAVMYVVLLVTGLLLWNVAGATGTIDNVERFMESFGWESFTFRGGAAFRAFALLGIFGGVLLTGVWVLAAVIFNLITDLVGGVQVTVLEEEVVERPVEDDPWRQ